MSNSTASLMTSSFPPTTSVPPPPPPKTKTTPSTTITKTKTVDPPSGRPRTTITRTSTAPITTPPPTSTSPPGLVPPSNDTSGGGLSKPATIAIAVVIPIVVVALLVLLAIFLWRRRKQRKVEQEARRKEVEEYGYNPNNDPTLPAVLGVGGGSDSPVMSEDTTGYRGWGNTVTSTGAPSGRKASTNLSSGVGMASENGGSPGEGDPFADSATGAATGVAAGGLAQRTSRNGNGVQRGPSNASSTYSAAGRTDDSGDILGGDNNNYSHYTSYNSNTGYGETSQPVIRDVSARRNTKIENAVYPQPGNSGIAQNF